MNSSLNNFARLAGPALGGLVMAKYSPTVCFAMNAVSYLAVIYCLFRIKNPSVKTERKEKNMLKELREGLSYTRGNPEISGVSYLLQRLYLCSSRRTMCYSPILRKMFLPAMRLLTVTSMVA